MARTTRKKNTPVLALDETPDYLVDAQDNNVDNFDSGDVVVPSVKLLQGVSDEISNEADAQPGEFWHTGTGTSLGSSFNFVVLARNKKALLMEPLDFGGAMLARAADAMTWDRMGSWKVQLDKKTHVTWEISDLNVERSGLLAWGSSDPDDPQSPPAATLFYDYAILVVDNLDFGPSVMSLARTALTRAKKGLNDRISMMRASGKPMQALVFEAMASSEAGPSNQSYYNWRFRQVGFASEELFTQATSIVATPLLTRAADVALIENGRKAPVGSDTGGEY